MANSKQINKKDGFSSRLGFIFAAVASAVGLANIWRFSSEAAMYGGGIFVCFYMLCVTVLGYPLSLAKMGFGRTYTKGLYHGYSKHGNWAYLGLFTVILGFLIYSFYNVVAGWVVGYLWKTLDGSLAKCSDYKKTFKDFRADYTINMICTLVMAIGAFCINYAGISGGVEKCAKILIPIFVVMMLGLIGYSLTLEGCQKGLTAYLWPNPSHFSWNSITNALSQSFMSLSIGIGVLVTYGAYVNKKENMVSSTAIIVAGDTIVAFLAGIFLFAFIGHQQVTGDGLQEVDLDRLESGKGLAFETLTQIFNGMGGWIGTIAAISFFLLLIFAAITSSIAMLEVPVKYACDRFKISRVKSLLIFSLASYVVGCICIVSDSKWPSLQGILWWNENYTFHDLMQDLIVKVCMPLAALLFSLFTGFYWKTERLFKEVLTKEQAQGWLGQYLHVTLKYVAPVLLAGITGYSIYNLFTP